MHLNYLLTLFFYDLLPLLNCHFASFPVLALTPTIYEIRVRKFKCRAKYLHYREPREPGLETLEAQFLKQTAIIADWASKNGSKKVVIVQSDWAPGAEAGKVFEANFTKGGGQWLEAQAALDQESAA